MKIRSRVTLWLILVISSASIVSWIGFSAEKGWRQTVNNAVTQYNCHRYLQTYVEQKRHQGSILSVEWLTAQFFFDYDVDKTPGPYVFINLVGSNDAIVASHVRFINAAGIFGPAPAISACTDLTRAVDCYSKSPNSAYANNMLALIHFQQHDPQQAIQHIRLAAQLVNSHFPAADLYSNRYQGLRALAWLVVNATNDQERYWASQQLVNSVSIDDVKPYSATLVDRIPLLSLYLDSLADVTRIQWYGANGIPKNRSLAQPYLQRYWRICHSKELSVACDADVLKHYKQP